MQNRCLEHNIVNTMTFYTTKSKTSKQLVPWIRKNGLVENFKLKYLAGLITYTTVELVKRFFAKTNENW